MHILFLTWKDIRHPNAGGAEKVIYEYASRLVKRGHRVTWFASSFRGAQSEEMIEGIEVIRKYTNNTLWMRAHSWYRSYKKTHTVDVIIDEAGGWPNLSPLYEKQIPIFFFVHHIGDREFDANTDFGILSPLVRTVAKFVYLRTFSLYRNIRAIVVSESTGDELVERFGLKRENITIIENTTELESIETIHFDTKTNDFVFLGRLTPMKRPEDAVIAFTLALPSLPKDSKLHIIGNTQDVNHVALLREIIAKKGLKDRVILHGHLPKAQFCKILQTSRALLVPSEKEGFGLIVLEGNANGIPAIAYDVAGLRDSIHDGQNGVLVPYADIQAMADTMRNMIENDEKYRILCQTSLDYVKHIPTGDEQAEKLEKLITIR